ncbi:Glycerophosphoryl diester phosphodiesterase [Paenibacillus sp. UNCCL117]|uniref:glycerophosphodiester phosphodiesterase n=1 Tax=unclassified Paenibacillus TaxID=185978 RepID=UPI00088DFE17|nr:MULTISPECIES: glycerophosphodiester phosphodiesterase family protein [unclassified Paenibacillus]SDD41076.1 Glycerophosphoryl diester phosphodiesterase [Paenibacillus sp. cl123]SFW47933.1 Glycerophosphoryl diester phosphodiesterase [Paenibacillus sp. UNCCL117]
MHKPKYIAHRGLSMHAPENTTAAFELAGHSGFWGIECDTYCTTDGHWIVHHDRTVDRMTDGTGKAKDFAFEAIRSLNIIAGIGIEAYAGLRIPALGEVLDICKRYKMHAFIEIEEYHHDADLENLVELVDRHDMLDNCSFICFNADDLKKVRAINGRVPLGYLSVKPHAAADLDLIEQLKPAFLDYDYRSVTPEDVRMLAAKGIDVSVWTVNSRSDAQPFIEAGVAYMTTDTILTDEAKK